MYYSQLFTLHYVAHPYMRFALLINLIRLLCGIYIVIAIYFAVLHKF